MAKTILVTGATGSVASQTIPQLTRTGARVRALVHDAAKARPLQNAGVEVLVADFNEPRTLSKAFDGVDAAFLVAPPNPRAAEQMHNLIGAARASGRSHVVRLSAVKAARDAPTDNGRQHHQADEELEASGLPYTILRPHFYMQNFFAALPTLQNEGKMYWGMGQGRMGMVDVRDIADVAATILLRGDHEGKTYTPTGPASITFNETARVLERTLGKKVEYVPITPEAVHDAIQQLGWGDWAADVMADYSRAYAAGWGDFTTEDVKRVTGNAPRPFEAFAREVMAPALQVPAGAR